MNVFEAMSLYNSWTLIKEKAMTKDEVISLVTHFATVALGSAATHAYVTGSEATALGTGAGVLAGVVYQIYTSRKLLNTPAPAKK